MAHLSRRELAERLSVNNNLLSFLTQHGVIVPSTPEESNGSRINRKLVYSPSDVIRAERAIANLKWIAVVSRDSWSRLTNDGLSYTLLSPRSARVAAVLRSGHRIAFYVTGVSAFCGIADVVGKSIARTTVWPQGAYPYRVPLAPQIGLPAEKGVKVKPLLDKLKFVAKKESWEQYFRTTIRITTDADFAVIERALAKEATRYRSERPSATRTG